jgi:hypothetical protein
VANGALLEPAVSSAPKLAAMSNEKFPELTLVLPPRSTPVNGTPFTVVEVTPVLPNFESQSPGKEKGRTKF